MKKATVPVVALAFLLSAGVSAAAEKKDKTVIDLKSIQSDNVAPNKGHATMGFLGERVHGGEFGPWRCQVKILDRRGQIPKMKDAGPTKEAKSTHFLSLSLMDPATGKGVPEGKGTVTVTGPGKKKVKADLQAFGGPWSADIDLPASGEYRIQVDFVSGKKKGAAKFTYTLK